MFAFLNESLEGFVKEATRGISDRNTENVSENVESLREIY